MPSPQELERKFWKALGSDMTMMLGLDGVEDGHVRPMTAQFEDDKGESRSRRTRRPTGAPPRPDAPPAGSSTSVATVGLAPHERQRLTLRRRLRGH